MEDLSGTICSVDMKEKFVHFYMGIARDAAQLSYAEKLKVGAILVKNNNILGFSYNGTASGHDNCAETKEWMHPDAGQSYTVSEMEARWPYVGYNEITNSVWRYNLITKRDVSHAEENLLLKLARSNESSEGGILFVTHNPCFTCSRMINAAGIVKVIYENEYRDSSGIQFLLDCGIQVEKYKGKTYE